MGVAKLVQIHKAVFDDRVNPCIGAVIGCGGTFIDNLGEIPIACHGETVGCDGFFERSRHMKAIKGYNGAYFWLYPENIGIIAGFGHWKIAQRIGAQKHRFRQGRGVNCPLIHGAILSVIISGAIMLAHFVDHIGRGEFFIFLTCVCGLFGLSSFSLIAPQ